MWPPLRVATAWQDPKEQFRDHADHVGTHTRGELTEAPLSELIFLYIYATYIGMILTLVEEQLYNGQN